MLAGRLKIKGFGMAIKATPLKEEDITLGCDPEFELIRDGKVTGAFESDPKTNEAYFNKCRIPGKYSNNGKNDTDVWWDRIGSDGDLVELRPLPAVSPEKLYDNFAELVKKIMAKGFKLSLRGDLFQSGGHVHIGVPFEIREEWGTRHKATKDSLKDTLIKALDVFVGKPIMCLNGGNRGKNNQYGMLGSYNRQDWGIEYRVPPSALFHNKKLFTVWASVLKKVVIAVCNNKELEIPSTTARRKDYEAIGVTKEEFIAFIAEIASARKAIEEKKKPIEKSEYLKQNIHGHRWSGYITELEVQ